MSLKEDIESVLTDEQKLLIKLDGVFLYLNGLKSKYIITREGKVYSTDYNHTKQVRQLKTTIGKDGYEYIPLQNVKDGKRSNYRLHRLMGYHFIPIPKKYKKKNLTYKDLQINHIDGVKTNNKLENLEWVTQEDNVKHAKEHKLYAYGEQNSHCKINENIVEKICKDIVENKLGRSDIAKKYNTTFHTVNDIIRKKSWVNISKKYDFSNYTAKSKNYKEGIECNFNKKSEDYIIEICEEIKRNKLSKREIDRKFNMSYGFTDKLIKGKIWKQLTKNYDFSSYNVDGRKQMHRRKNKPYKYKDIK